MADSLTPGDFWKAQGMRAIATCIVTAEGPEGPAGFLALSVAHLTASPPVMTVSAMPSTSGLEAIRHSGGFALNFLSSGQEALLSRFSGPTAPKGAARFAGLSLTHLSSCAPILPDIVGAMDCMLLREEDAFGVHLLFGQIIATRIAAGARPQIHFGGKVMDL